MMYNVHVLNYTYVVYMHIAYSQNMYIFQYLPVEYTLCMYNVPSLLPSRCTHVTHHYQLEIIVLSMCRMYSINRHDKVLSSVRCNSPCGVLYLVTWWCVVLCNVMCCQATIYKICSENDVYDLNVQSSLRNNVI